MKSAFSISFPAAACAAALALVLSAPAHADSTQVVNLTLGAGVTQTGSFTDVITATGAFTDDYIFQTPPPFATEQFTGTVASGIQFTSVSLITFGGGSTNALVGVVGASSFSEATAGSVNSGLYMLEIKGIALTVGGSYSGTITANTGSQVPVPEPETWALMLLGLGATGIAARRRPASA